MARMGALLRLLISTSTSSEPVNKADFLPVALSTCTRDDAFFSCPTEIRGVDKEVVVQIDGRREGVHLGVDIVLDEALLAREAAADLLDSRLVGGGAELDLELRTKR